MINWSDPRLAEAILAERYQTAARERQITQVKRMLAWDWVAWHSRALMWLGYRLTDWGCYLQVRYQDCEKVQCST